MSDQAQQLIADIVSANVKNLASLTNSIEAGLRRDVISAAEAVLELWEIVEQATVIDRRTERGLDWFAPRVGMVEQLLEHAKAMQEKFDAGG